MSTLHELSSHEQPAASRWSGEEVAETPSLRLGNLDIPLPEALRGPGPLRVYADVVYDDGAVLQVVIGRPEQLPIDRLESDRWTRSLTEIVLREWRRQQLVGVAKNCDSHEVMTDDQFDSWWECPVDEMWWQPMDMWYLDDPEDPISRGV